MKKSTEKGLLIIPVENQVRELDAKLLLACIAATRGFSCVVGSRLELDFRIASFPPGTYLAKSMTERSVKMFRIMCKLGHKIAAWDEEALVHQPPGTYFSRRLSPNAIRYVSSLFAWGEDNARLWQEYPDLPPSLPIYITGNPRGDMLRPEMRPYYAQEVEALCSRYGDFLLINTNFSNVNAYYPSQNLFLPVEEPGAKPKFGRAAVGMSREFAEGLQDYKQAIFNDFKRLIPALEKAFPKHTIVVRPHPTENPKVYLEIASQCERVIVTNEGNVIPWLSAAKALVHNGCTTGIEAYILRVPAVAYRATVNDYYDCGFYRLPNALSHETFDFEELQNMVREILAGKAGPAGGEERKTLMESYMASLHGPLASQRIVDVLDRTLESGSDCSQADLSDRLYGRYLAAKRRTVKRIKARFPRSKYRPEFQRYRYPGISVSDLYSRLKRLQSLVGEPKRFIVEHISDFVYRISA